MHVLTLPDILKLNVFFFSFFLSLVAGYNICGTSFFLSPQLNYEGLLAIELVEQIQSFFGKSLTL